MSDQVNQVIDQVKLSLEELQKSIEEFSYDTHELKDIDIINCFYVFYFIKIKHFHKT